MWESNPLQSEWKSDALPNWANTGIAVQTHHNPHLGLEPRTFWLEVRRAIHCASGEHLSDNIVESLTYTTFKVKRFLKMNLFWVWLVIAVCYHHEVLAVGFEPTKPKHGILSATPLTAREYKRINILNESLTYTTFKVLHKSWNFVFEIAVRMLCLCGDYYPSPSYRLQIRLIFIYDWCCMNSIRPSSWPHHSYYLEWDSNPRSLSIAS